MGPYMGCKCRCLRAVHPQIIYNQNTFTKKRLNSSNNSLSCNHHEKFCAKWIIRGNMLSVCHDLRLCPLITRSYKKIKKITGAFLARDTKSMCAMSIHEFMSSSYQKSKGGKDNLRFQTFDWLVFDIRTVKYVGWPKNLVSGFPQENRSANRE